MKSYAELEKDCRRWGIMCYVMLLMLVVVIGGLLYADSKIPVVVYDSRNVDYVSQEKGWVYTVSVENLNVDETVDITHAELVCFKKPKVVTL